MGLTYCFLLTGGCTLSRSEPERQQRRRQAPRENYNQRLSF